MRFPRVLLPALLAGLTACAESTAPNNGGFAAGSIDGRTWLADSAVAMVQDSSLVIGAFRRYGGGRVDGFTALVHHYSVPSEIELAGAGARGAGFFSDAPEGSSFLGPGPTQTTDSLHRGLLKLEEFNRSDSILTGTVAFMTAPRFQYPGHTIAVHFRMRLVVAQPPASPSASTQPVAFR